MSVLPSNFPTKGLSDADRYRIEWVYRRYVEDYFQEYKFGHFILAAYAAIPPFLTPDLLYTIWQNCYQYRWRGNTSKIHRIAVADILLSPVCRDAGFELYEMNFNIRLAFQGWLQAEYEQNDEANLVYSPEHIATLLDKYHQKANPGTIRWGSNYENIQKNGAMVFNDHAQLQRLLTAQLQAALKNGHQTEAASILDFWSKSARQLESVYQKSNNKQIEAFVLNAQFVTPLKNYLSNGDDQALIDSFYNDARLKEMLSADNEGGIVVNIPETLSNEITEVPPPTLHGLIISASDHPNIYTLSDEFVAIVNSQGKKSSIKQYFGPKTSLKEIKRGFEDFKKAPQGDICLVYYNGPINNINKDGTGRLFTFPANEDEFTQAWMEEQCCRIAREKMVHFVLIFDTNNVYSQKDNSKLRKQFLRLNPSALKGSVVIINRSGIGQDDDASSRFTDTLREVLHQFGSNLSYNAIVEKIHHRLVQNNSTFSPNVEAFPAKAGDYLFFSEKTDNQVAYIITWNQEKQEWRLNAGANKGITPSLHFMKTYLFLKNRPNIRVNIQEVFDTYSTLEGFQEGDTKREFAAILGQKALPKVNIAFGPDCDPTLKTAFLEAVKQYQIYYINIIDNLAEARYFINTTQKQYFITRHLQHPDSPNQPAEPVYGYVKDAYRFIVQMERIAQWRGVLDMDNPSGVIPKNSLELEFEIIEGQSFTAQNIDSRIGTIASVNNGLNLHYQFDQQQKALQPAFRCKMNTSLPNLYVAVLYLDENFGISHFGSYVLQYQTYTRAAGFDQSKYVNFIFNEYRLSTIPGLIEKTRTTPANVFLKFIISDKEINASALVQEKLSEEQPITRSKGIKAQNQNTFDIQSANWSTVTIPMKIHPPTSKYKEYLKEQLAKGYLELVLNELLEATGKNGQTRLHNELVAQSASFHRIQQEKRSGIISGANYSVAWNRINNAMLYYLDQFVDDWERPAPIPLKKFVPLPDTPQLKLRYEEISIKELEVLAQNGLALLVTATSTETAALHRQMQPVTEGGQIMEVIKGGATYYVGLFGKYLVANVECGTMGTASSMGSLVTIVNAIGDLNPKLVLMVGIAFGIDPEKQNIGDVLISNILLPYEIQRVSTTEVVDRGSRPEASNLLRNRFKNVRDWEYTLPNGEVAKSELCDILTGEKLVDNVDFRKELQRRFPTAQGGEMEGAGLYAASNDKNVPWILVKAICDYADGLKKENKKEKQHLAITVALNLCQHVFNKKTVFDGLLNPYNAEKLSDAILESNNSGSKLSFSIEIALELLNNGKIPELFTILDNAPIPDKFSYNRFKREYQAGINGIDLMDWRDRMEVFIRGIMA
jgi:nucleoside phosphorylase